MEPVAAEQAAAVVGELVTMEPVIVGESGVVWKLVAVILVVARQLAVAEELVGEQAAAESVVVESAVAEESVAVV